MFPSPYVEYEAGKQMKMENIASHFQVDDEMNIYKINVFKNI